MLLILEAHDQASGIIGKVTGAFNDLGTRVKAAAAQASMSTEQLQAVQDRAAAAATAYQRAQSEQANQQAILRQSTVDLALAEEEYAAKAAAAAEAASKVAGATGEQAAAAQEAARVTAESAKLAADTVEQASARQVVALDAVAQADREVATRSAESAEAQKAAAAGTGIGTAALKGLATTGAVAAVAVGAIGVHAVKAAGDFQASMERLVTSAGESQSAVSGLSSQVLKLSVDSATSTKDLSSGLYMVESAGFHAKAGMDVLTASAQGARAENASLEEVTNALTSALNAYGKGADQSVAYTDMMVAAVGQGKMKMQDLASSLSNVLPVAAAAGVSFQQVSGAIATMTSQGMSAQQATQDLAHLIQKLQTPTAESVKYMAQLGLNAQDLSAHLGDRGLTGTLQLVYTAIEQHMGPAGKVVVDAFNQSQSAAQGLQAMLGSMAPDVKMLATQLQAGTLSFADYNKAIKGLSGASHDQGLQFLSLYNSANGFNSMLKSGNPAALTFSAALKQVFGDQTSLNSALLLGGDHLSTFQTNVGVVSDAAAKAGKNVNGWSQIQGTFNFKLAQLKESVHASVIALGTGLLPIVTKLATEVAKVVVPFAQWMTTHQKLAAIILTSIGTFGALITTFIGVGLALKAVRQSAAEFKIVMEALSGSSPWMIALTALAMIAILIATHWKQTKAVLKEVWDWIKGAASDVAGFFTKIWQDVVKVWDQVWSDVAGVVKKWWPLILAPITGGLSIIVGLIIKYRKDIAQAFQAVWDDVVNIWNSTGGKLVSLISGAWDSISKSVTREWDKITGDLMKIWSEWNQIWMATVGRLVLLIISHWQQISAVTSAVWNVVSTVISLVWGNIWSGTSGAVTAIVDVVKVGWALLWGYIKSTMDVVWGDVKAAWDLISGGIKAACDLIYGVIVKPAFDAIVGYFEITWDFIKGIFNTTLDAIKNILAIFVDLFTGKWSKMWQDIKNLGSQFLGDISNSVTSIFNDIKRFLTQTMDSVKQGVVGAWNDIKTAVTGAVNDLWNGIQGAFTNGLSALGRTWDGLKKLAADPVNFVINTVYTNGIAKVWNAVVSLVGGDQAPVVKGFAQGGLVPGVGATDHVPAMLMPGEFVLSHSMIRDLGGIDAVQSRFGAGGGDGYHYSLGGFVKGIGSDIVGAAKSIGGDISGAFGSVMNELKSVALGAVREAVKKAFDVINAGLGAIPGGGKTGFGKLMVDGVHTAEGHILDFLGGKDKQALANAPKGMPGAVAGWIQTAMVDTGAPGSWLSALEVIAMNESGGNPNAINNYDINAQHGDPSRGLMQTIMSTFMAYHQAGTSMDIYDPVANAAAAINYIKAVYGTVNNVPGIKSLARGGPYVGYENGTWDTGAHEQLALLHPHEAVLPAGALKGNRLTGGGGDIHIHLEGSTFWSDQQIDQMTDKIGRRLTTHLMPAAGRPVRM